MIGQIVAFAALAVLIVALVALLFRANGNHDHEVAAHDATRDLLRKARQGHNEWALKHSHALVREAILDAWVDNELEYIDLDDETVERVWESAHSRNALGMGPRDSFTHRSPFAYGYYCAPRPALQFKEDVVQRGQIKTVLDEMNEAKRPKPPGPVEYTITISPDATDFKTIAEQVVEQIEAERIRRS